MKLVTGQHVIFTAGEYSEYSVCGLYRVLRDVDDAVALYKRFEDQRARDWPKTASTGFEDFLVAGGYLEEIKYDEMNHRNLIHKAKSE